MVWPCSNRTLFAALPFVLPVTVALPEMLKRPRTATPPPLTAALLPVMRPPFIVNTALLAMNTPPPVLAELPLIWPPFIMNVPLTETPPPRYSAELSLPLPPVIRPLLPSKSESSSVAPAGIWITLPLLPL